MAKKSLWRVVAVMAAAALALAVAGSAFAQAPPVPPHQFFGNGGDASGAILDGETAPDGAVVTAWNQDGDNVGESEIADGVWLIQVDADAASSVTFSIDGSEQSESFEVSSGLFTEVTLDLASGAPDDGGGDIGLPATGNGGLAGNGSGLPVLPLVLALSVGLALGGVALTRRSLRA